jgi:hypothetical protein
MKKEIKYVPLKHSDLTKRGGDRISIFAEKLKIESPFGTVKGPVKLDKKQKIGNLTVTYTDIKNMMQRPGFNAVFVGKHVDTGAKVTVTYPKDFYKTADFGGKGEGAGTQAEDAALTVFRTHLIELLESLKLPSIKLKIGNRIVECAGVITTPNPGGRAPKADFSIINIKSEQVAWISHKAGTKASDFQQYGGISDDPWYQNNADTKSFVQDLIALRPEGLKAASSDPTQKQSIARVVKDKAAVRRAIYGKNYGQTQRGIYNVDEFHLGTMKLSKKGNVYEITSLHKGLNGDIPDEDFTAIYFARYTSDRGAKFGSLFVNKTRLGIFAMAKAPKSTTEFI